MSRFLAVAEAPKKVNKEDLLGIATEATYDLSTTIIFGRSSASVGDDSGTDVASSPVQTGATVDNMNANVSVHSLCWEMTRGVGCFSLSDTSGCRPLSKPYDVWSYAGPRKQRPAPTQMNSSILADQDSDGTTMAVYCAHRPGSDKLCNNCTMDRVVYQNTLYNGFVY